MTDDPRKLEEALDEQHFLLTENSSLTNDNNDLVSDEDARARFNELYGTSNEFLVGATGKLNVICNTHDVQFRLETLTDSHFNFVGEKDSYDIWCSIPSFKSAKKEHVVRFRNNAGKPFASVIIKQSD